MNRMISSLLLACAVLLAGCGAPPSTLTPVAQATAASPSTATLTPEATKAVAATHSADAPPVSTATTAPASTWIAYTGADRNIWLIDPTAGEVQQITTDGAPFQPGVDSIEYCCSTWSPDGKLLAFQRTLMKVAGTGYDVHYSLWVYNFQSRQVNVLLENQQALGFEWQPGSHLLAYGPPIPPEYFARRGGVDPVKAGGIWAVDADTGAAGELVPPQRGLALVNPRWSPDGKTLAFEEIIAMEGRGTFAFYRFETQEYVSWERAIGQVAWLPGSAEILYDTLTYSPSGEEKILRNNLAGTEERQVSLDVPNGIAFAPVVSPAGDYMAYLTETMLGQGLSEYQVMVQPLDGGAAQSLGKYEQPADLAWSPDGRLLAFTNGSMDDRRLVLVELTSREAVTLDRGSDPAWQPEP